ncbi:MAG: DUF3160 domain-containing protein [Verrucomicrobia bacterium]|nr:DUF3160 domain-containing protein [Verrucomicrobiota bacterium]
MKTFNARIALSTAAILAALTPGSKARDPEVSLRIFPESARVSTTLPPADTPHSLSTRRTLLESSTDLKTWLPEGTELITAPDGPRQTAQDIPLPGPRRFFRVRIVDTPSFLASGGADVFGYSTAFAERLSLNSDITPGNFTAWYPAGASLPGVSFDVATAEYYPEWNADPAVWNAALPPGSTNQRLTDFRLDPASQQKLLTNGFVVSEARGAVSFTDLYYRIWTDDLPVFVTSDSILHAWHRTWITMLEEIEELALRPRLVTLVTGLRTHLDSATVPSALAQGMAEAQSFLENAATLASYVGTSPPTLSGFPLAAVEASMVADEFIFGSLRTVDWTQFGPRSHYTNSETLKSYFRTMMWLSIIDFRIDERAEDQSLRQLEAAMVLTLALRDAGLMAEWEEIDRILTTFVGRADSMTPPQLLEILQSENLGSMSAITSSAVVENLLVRIQAGEAGVQDILAHPIEAPIAEEKLVLPRSFTFFSQRFTPESWAMGRMVFDNIWRVNADPAGAPMVRVLRRLPSALDINFAVMGNNTPASLLAQRMTSSGVPYRDGLDYSRELVSVREVMDSQPPEAWGGTLYLHQLGALRTLSDPLPASVPEAMRTEAWKWKTVQTQLAGWTELRHDNLLYAKQSYTPPVLCFYPAGYVEPRPAFYVAMKQLVDFASATLTSLPMSGTYPGRPIPEGDPITVNLASRKAQWLAHFSGMSSSLQSLAEIAQSEVNHTPFSADQTIFIQELVQVVGDYAYNGRSYSGWYPRMYLKSVFANAFDPHPSEMWDPLVTDVHTDGPDFILTGDPGAVLYNATGNAALMLVAIDVNGQRCLHGGPAFTYYEFTRAYGQTRLTDETWKTQVRNQAQPAHPEWTTSWLTPGPITVPVYTP